MRDLARDVRYAWRGLLGSPIFTIVALVSIALGIGANTAIFTLVDRVLMRALPVEAPDQLVLLDGPAGRHYYGASTGSNVLSFPMYEDLRDAFVADGSVRVSTALVERTDTRRREAPVLSGLFARYGTWMNVRATDQTERVPAELVTGTYFPVLGVGAAAGRVLTADDDRRPGEHPVVVLGYDYWRTHFGGDPRVIGTTIRVNDYPLTIVGVAERGFQGVDLGLVPSLHVPMTMKAQVMPQTYALDERRVRWANVFGRLQPGVTVDGAKAALQPFFHALLEAEVREPAFRNAAAAVREQFVQGRLDVLPAAQGRMGLRRQLAQPLWSLMAMVGAVLLIACANVAGLLTARAASREREIAVRLALGAGRGRIVSQLVAESLLLGTIGGALGLLIASWTSRFMIGMLLAADAPHGIASGLDRRVLAFNIALSLVTGLAFGVLPALRATAGRLSSTLHDRASTAGLGGLSGVRFRKGLVIAQVSLSVLLLIAAGLFVRSLRNLRLLDLGFRTDRIVAFDVDPTLSGYDPVRAKRFHEEVASRLRATPQVEAVAFANMGILTRDWWTNPIAVAGYQPGSSDDMVVRTLGVSPGYVATLGMTLLHGRDFDARDAQYDPPPAPGSTAPPPYRVAIVNESFARHYFGGRTDVIGRRIGLGRDPGTPTPIEIVGVVGDAKYGAVRDEVPRQVFLPVLEHPYFDRAVMYIRTSAPPAAVMAAARQIVAEIDRRVPIYNTRTLAEQAERSMPTERLIATLSTAFGTLATVLALVGLYGVMAFTVARRTREIGVRMALGAASRDVVWLVMREVLMLVASGVMVGLAAAWMLGRFVQSQLYAVPAHDVVTMAGAALLLTAVALSAGYVPAWRATRVNPVRALRSE